MASKHPRVLIAEPDHEAAGHLTRLLDDHGFVTDCFQNGDDVIDAVARSQPDAVLTEYALNGSTGLKLISALHLRVPRLPVIMITGERDSATVIEATKGGAYDFLTKPFDDNELLEVLASALKSSRLMSKPVEIGQLYEDQDTIIGRSRAMTGLYKELGRIASKPVTVLIRGETGAGKELIARAIYQHGHRAHRPFVPVNCAAIPENLLETELFGHEKGAFTGADKLRIGKFEQAHNGTLFLDEIGDLSLALQAKLLRVLQDKLVQRVGGRATIPVDVRIIAATHRPLEQMVEAGTFRADLFYRLNVASINIPPLRDRREDIPPLVDYFVRRFAGEFDVDSPSIDPEGLKFLQNQDWPGNVRQLQNVIWKALLSSRGYTIVWSDLRDVIDESEIRTPSGDHPASLRDLVDDTLRRTISGELEAALPVLREELERELFAAAIKKAHGNQAKAARWLGVSRLTMREKLHRYHLHPAGPGKNP